MNATKTSTPRYRIFASEGDGDRVFVTETEAQEYGFAQAVKLHRPIAAKDLLTRERWDIYPE